MVISLIENSDVEHIQNTLVILPAALLCIPLQIYKGNKFVVFWELCTLRNTAFFTPELATNIFDINWLLYIARIASFSTSPLSQINAMFLGCMGYSYKWHTHTVLRRNSECTLSVQYCKAEFTTVCVRERQKDALLSRLNSENVLIIFRSGSPVHLLYHTTQ